MSLKFVIDMNLSPQWTEIFRREGWVAIHWSEIGAATAEDSVILTWALMNQYVVFTHDLDFSAILAATQANAPSVLQLRAQDILPESIVTSVFAAIHQFEDQLERGALVVVDPKKSRVKILPIYRS